MLVAAACSVLVAFLVHLIPGESSFCGGLLVPLLKLWSCSGTVEGRSSGSRRITRTLVVSGHRDDEEGALQLVWLHREFCQSRAGTEAHCKGRASGYPSGLGWAGLAGRGAPCGMWRQRPVVWLLKPVMAERTEELEQ